MRARLLLCVLLAACGGDDDPPAPPPALTLPERGASVTVDQRSTAFVPGSNGRLRVHLGDITRGQVQLSLATADGATTGRWLTWKSLCLPANTWVRSCSKPASKSVSKSLSALWGSSTMEISPCLLSPLSPTSTIIFSLTALASFGHGNEGLPSTAPNKDASLPSLVTAECR